jgi:hypothetical protein
MRQNSNLFYILRLILKLMTQTSIQEARDLKYNTDVTNRLFLFPK